MTLRRGMGGRRSVRGGVLRAGGGGGAGGATHPPLPASAVEYWHQAFDVTVVPSVGLGLNEITGWQGQLRGDEIQPPESGGAASLYDPDGAYFGGRSVVQSYISGSRFLRSITGGFSPPLFAAATRPYMFVVGRLRTPYASGFPGIVAVTSAGSVNSPSILSASGLFTCYAASGGAAGTADLRPGEPTVLEGFLDASGFTQLSRLGLYAAPYSGAGAQTIPASAINLAVGSTWAGAVSDFSAAFVMLCASVPTVAEREALREWAYIEWSFAESMARIAGAKLILDLNSDWVTVGGGKATNWTDQAVRGNNISQPAGSLQPLVVASVMDGHAALRFDGTNDVFDLTTMAGIPANNTRFYIYIIWDPRSAASLTYTAEPYALSINGTEGVGSVCSFYHYTDTGLYQRITGTVMGAIPDPAALAPRLNTMRFENGSGSTCNLDSNNVSFANWPTGWGHSPAPYLRIGNRFDNAFPANMDLFRLVMVVNPTDAQHARIIAHFKTQYPTLGLA